MSSHAKPNPSASVSGSRTTTSSGVACNGHAVRMRSVRGRIPEVKVSLVANLPGRSQAIAMAMATASETRTWPPCWFRRDMRHMASRRAGTLLDINGHRHQLNSSKVEPSVLSWRLLVVVNENRMQHREAISTVGPHACGSPRYRQGGSVLFEVVWIKLSAGDMLLPSITELGYFMGPTTRATHCLPGFLNQLNLKPKI